MPPSEWRAEQLARGHSKAKQLIAEAHVVAETVTARARPDAEKMVRKCRKRAMKDARRQHAAGRKTEKAMQRQLAEAQGALAEKQGEVSVKQAQVDKLVEAQENVNTKALEAINQKKAEFDTLRIHVRETKEELAQLSTAAETERTRVTELQEQAEREDARVSAAKAQYEALHLGLHLFERRQIRWEPLLPGEPRQLVWGPQGSKPAPLPKAVKMRLAPAMSLLEMIIELICQILEALFAPRELAVVQDVEIVQRARLEIGLEPDMTIEDVLARRTGEVVLEL